mmetsp:Transcript_116231/g.163378  ORF Transcript_116231/g.163378 Transcript_116231/m.163378 type:complete len:205 (-) Transcript_116231:45-659(-)
MVIPMQTPQLSGPIPPQAESATKRMKYAVMGMAVTGIGRLLCALMQGLLAADFFAILSVFIAFCAGTFLFKEDERFASAYKCLASSVCSTCAAQGMGGLQCLMPFMMLSLVNCVLDLLLKSRAIAIFPFGIFLLASCACQGVGAYNAWAVYKIARDLAPQEGTEMGGGGFVQGEQAGLNNDAPSSQSQASSFQPFTGSGSRLGG